MALLSLQAFKTKWAAITGRFKDNNTFDIAEKDYREFSTDIADSLFDPVEKLAARVEKLEQPAPPAPEGFKWKVYPKVSTEGNTVKVTPAEIEVHGQVSPLPTPNAKENVPLPPVGWGERIDILAASADGWVYIYGQDPGVTPAFEHPDQPGTELLFAAYLFWSNAGGAVEEPVVFVRVVEMDGQEYSPDANGRLILPKSGTTINSTDDIQSEGAFNKWFTDARAIAARATSNLWGYLGLANSTATISLKGWLDFLTNKVKTNEDNIATKVSSVNGKSGATVSIVANDIDYTTNNSTFFGAGVLKVKAALDKLASLAWAVTDRWDTLSFSSYTRSQRVYYNEKITVQAVELSNIATMTYIATQRGSASQPATTSIATLNSQITNFVHYTIEYRVTLAAGKNFGEAIVKSKLG
ncbi:hypothetical protein [Pontibacter kalidii]|uniref:hypothetical protein n=1 Tax=Pontibacter kalidii TaxID=2592049 RepID=UPI002250D6FD|nr:hypothetical protein [Pontibacter kalidii]